MVIFVFFFTSPWFIHAVLLVARQGRVTAIRDFLEFLQKKNQKKRQRWLQSRRRADPNDRSKSWTPSSDDRVCKAHFLTGNCKSVALVVEDGDFSNLREICMSFVNLCVHFIILTLGIV